MINSHTGIFGNSDERLLGIFFVIAMIIPHTSTILYLVNPMMCLWLSFKYYRRINTYNNKVSVITVLLISFVINITTIIEFKSIILAVTLLIYFFFFPFVGNIKFKPIYLWLTFGVIFISQIAYLIQIPFITALLDTLYPIGFGENDIMHMADTITTNTIYDYRLGGLYRNANDCARSLCFVMAVAIAENTSRTNKLDMLFPILIMGAILLTGSRTGFVVGVLLLLLYFFRNDNQKSIVRYLIPTFLLLFLLFAIKNGSEVFRGLNVAAGFNNSANTKFDVLLDYLRNETNPFNYLMGNFDVAKFIPSSNNLMNYFDGDYGNLIYCYGFVGFVSIITFYLSLFKCVNKNTKIFFVVFLWAISNSLVVSFRMVFVLMLVLSRFYSQYLDEQWGLENQNESGL